MDLLVLTGTTGFPLLESHIQNLAGQYPDLRFLLQSPNRQQERANIRYQEYLDLENLDCTQFSGVIGHCGAGTVFWALERRLPLIAIVDLSRPDGHQSDLGDWLSRNNYGAVVVNRGPSYEEISNFVDNEYAKYEKEPFSVSKINLYLHEEEIETS